MFDLHLLHLPPLNLLNIHLYYSETNYERAMKSPFVFVGRRRSAQVIKVWEI